MKPPESSCYFAVATKETTVAKEDEGEMARWRRRRSLLAWLDNEEFHLGVTKVC